MDKKTINIAFWFDAPENYFGGINYFKNLIFAISKNNSEKVNVLIFFSTETSEETLNIFRPFAKVIQTTILSRYSPLWFINKILNKIFKSQFLVYQLFKIYSIDILSHSWEIFKPTQNLKIISWIPDFQYLHLPHYFENYEVKKESKRLKKIISYSDLIILSSKDALKDFKSVASSQDQKKGEILNFVSQVDFEKIENYKVNLEKKFRFTGKYFFLPNQFWQHKNHILVFEALKILKEKQIDVKLICSGEISDFRQKKNNHIKKLFKFLEENNLTENVLILGKIDYIDVLKLILHSIATINPSYFEGWSSTVEESKSLNKTILLSNIDVHKEQNPKKGIFFSPDNIHELAKIMEKEWNNSSFIDEKNIKKSTKIDLEDRTNQFGKEYLDIIKKIKK